MRSFTHVFRLHSARRVHSTAAASRIARGWHGYRTRLCTSAAIAIQACFRRHGPHTKLNSQRSAAHTLQADARRSLALAELDTCRTAALSLQASIRCSVQCAQHLRSKHCILALQLRLRASLNRHTFSMYRHCAVPCQALVRREAARRAYALRAGARRLSAERIQAVLRRQLSFSALSRWQRAVRSSSVWHGVVVSEESCNAYTAAWIDGQTIPKHGGLTTKSSQRIPSVRCGLGFGVRLR